MPFCRLGSDRLARRRRRLHRRGGRPDHRTGGAGDGRAFDRADQGVIFSGENRDGLAGKDRWLVERLDEYPYMDFGIFGDREALREKHLGVLSPGGIFALPVITGRGCPYRCTYCSNSALIDYYGA
ncbi:MAG: hypothetical protein MZW92_31130 [Comamonadaceae bacterium]|nr:hypothetical protein [Comamonadaceae bacterium]